ncbi:MAG: branched chain amino acid aminotransferase [Phototrophicaceae bacterium]
MSDMRYIAMWSGPRNISTAMMRAWENRDDTIVHDEPFYAHYLANTEYDHPSKQAIINAYETDWRKVAEQLTEKLPQNKSIYYQKHMTHHMLSHIEKEWMLNVTNCFLIRDPRRVLLSFSKVIPNPDLEQTGLPQQIDLFNFVREQTGKIPPVLSSKDVLSDPRLALTALCDAINIPFDEAMLSWRAGKRDSDGIWAKHWYASVEKSTEFMPYQEDDKPIPEHLRPVLEECNALYQQMEAYRLLK